MEINWDRIDLFTQFYHSIPSFLFFIKSFEFFLDFHYRVNLFIKWMNHWNKGIWHEFHSNYIGDLNNHKLSNEIFCILLYRSMFNLSVISVDFCFCYKCVWFYFWMYWTDLNWFEFGFIYFDLTKFNCNLIC